MPTYGEAPRGDALVAQIQARDFCQYTFELFPDLWAIPEIATYYSGRTWTSLKFTNPPPPTIPKQSGIYMFVVGPYSGNLKDHSYVFYVGQSDNLRARYRQYLDEQRGLGPHPRPKVVKFLSHLKDYVYFQYTLVPESELNDAENLLKDNLSPPGNDRKTILGRLTTS